jgi:UDPglucose--hexose-1-phosphate uridylyltransferase
VLAAYRDWNLASFNFALIGGGPQARESGQQVVLKLISRSNPDPVYRSDATYFERLHAEALIDLSPEEIAADGTISHSLGALERSSASTSLLAS